jgi:hypothetical protein
MVAYVFDNILTKGVRAGQIPARTQAARRWYRNEAEKVDVTPSKLMRENGSKVVRGYEIGSMMLFQYDPKFKRKLPYYDTFPLVFPIEPRDNGFLGLNMHYLPLRQRAMLMDALYTLRTDSRYDENTALKLSYQILKRSARYKLFKPCVKHYLSSNIKSRRIKIDPVEWDMALFMPLQRFQKASSSQVYSKSMEMVS